MTNLPDRMVQYRTTNYDQLPVTDKKFLSDEEIKLVETAINKEWTNPKFKLRWFVGETQITPFAKLRQWLLELKGREENIERMEYEIEKLQLDIQIEQRNSENTSDDLVAKKFQLEIKKLNRELGISQRRLNDYYLERQQLVDLINELLESEDGKTDDGRSLLEVLNTDEENDYEAQYWTNRLAKQAAMDMIFYGRINSGNMDAICSLPSEQQGEVLQLCYSYAAQNQSIQGQLQAQAEQMLSLGHKDTQDLKVATLEAPKTDTSEETLDVYRIRNAAQ